jgi:twitching motility protein PilT
MLSNPKAVFTAAIQAGASDVHVAVDAPLLFRVDGVLTAQGEMPLAVKEVEKFVNEVIGDALCKELEERREVDAAYALEDGNRLRVNCHFERGNPGLVARVIPSDIPAIEQVGLEAVMANVETYSEGLVLFTGPTGAGKSTSLAALLRHISEQRACSVVTLEDPIEFLFPQGKGVFRQRQLGQDFLSFPEALKRILRQDPNIVMVGEMRDPETIAAALTLAETGHLIFATLHTPNAAQTIDRIIDVFPPHQQPQIRSQLSMSLKMVVAQRLLPKAGGGRIANREVLVMTPAAANTIREDRLPELQSVLQTGGDAGMCSFEKDLKRLYKEELIEKAVMEAYQG